MLTSGDVIDLDLGLPTGNEAGFRHPAIVVTAQEILDHKPTVIHVVPLTSTIRSSPSEITISAKHSGLKKTSAAQCQHIRAISAARIENVRGNVGTVDLLRIREVLALLLDLA